MRSLLSLIIMAAVFLGGVYVGAKHQESVNSTINSLMGASS